MTPLVLLAAVVLVVIGLAGIVVPVLPGGSLLVGAGIALWAWHQATTEGWAVFALAAALLIVGVVGKWVLPSRSLKQAGIPLSTQLVGALCGVVGFFVVPVIGLVIGFVVGVYAAELRRVGRAEAWPSTKAGLAAAGQSILIELGAALTATVAWIVGMAVA